MKRILKVHVENGRGQPAALTLEQDRLEAKIATRSSLRHRVSISVNDDPDRFAERAGDAEIIFAAHKPASFASAPHLKWVQSISAGVETLLPLLPSGVALTNASGVHAAKAAEFVLTSVLMLNYKIPRFVTNKERRAWEPDYGGTVAGKVAMLLGVGAIGSAAARLLKSFGLETIGITRSGSPHDGLDQSATLAQIDGLLGRTDFLISSLPLTPGTAGLIGRSQLDLLPPRAGVVVVGRAQVFDYDALADKLHDGTLAGAILDVFAQEPLPASDRLWKTPRLVMTPHCSLDDHTTYLESCLDIFVENLDRYATGRELLNVVDPAAGY